MGQITSIQNKFNEYKPLISPFFFLFFGKPVGTWALVLMLELVKNLEQYSLNVSLQRRAGPQRYGPARRAG